MVAAEPPEPSGVGLTFWRRSIQARVVVSTVLLSAIVVTAVGWFLLRQVEQGLVDRRVDTVLTEVGNENDAGTKTGSTPCRATRPTPEQAQTARGLDTSGRSAGSQVVMARPAGHGAAPRPIAAAEFTAQRDLRSVPHSLVGHFDGLEPKEAMDTTYDFIRCTRQSPTQPPAARDRGRDEVHDPGGRHDAHGLLPVPARRRAADPDPGDPRRCSPRASCCSP